MVAILIVEDEAIVAVMAEAIVEELGYDVIGPAADVQSGLEMIARYRIDAALLDINLGGDRVYPVADALKVRGIPFAFVTGYGSLNPEQHYDCQIVAKPYQEAHIAEAIEEMLRPRAA